MTNTTDQILIALTFLAGVIRSAELNCVINKTTVQRFQRMASGCDTVVRTSGSKNGRVLSQFRTLRELGLVREFRIDDTTFGFEVTPEGRAFKARFFGAVYGKHTDVSENVVGRRAMMTF